VVVAFPPSASATWPGKPGRIAFHGAGGFESLFSIRHNGRGVRRIVKEVDSSREEADVAWSPNGKRIAYFDFDGDLMQARANGSHARRVVRLSAGEGESQAWSRDGKHLLYDRNAFQVWIVRLDGRGLHKLVRGQVATWSSRGLIAFANPRGNVVTMRPDGSHRRTRVRESFFSAVRHLDFSGDGRKLAYLQDQNGNHATINTIDLRTGKRTRFPNDEVQVSTFDVAWVPNQDRLAYLQTTGDSERKYEHIRTIRPDGTDSKTLFRLPNVDPVARDEFGGEFGMSEDLFAWQTHP
jgi:Tol biopolymer transport system component